MSIKIMMQLHILGTDIRLSEILKTPEIMDGKGHFVRSYSSVSTTSSKAQKIIPVGVIFKYFSSLDASYDMVKGTSCINTCFTWHT